MLIAIFFIVGLRTVAIIFKWNLPVPKGEGEGIKETNQDPVPSTEKELSIK
jgi:hypothetical protein